MMMKSPRQFSKCFVLNVPTPERKKKKVTLRLVEMKTTEEFLFHFRVSSQRMLMMDLVCTQKLVFFANVVLA